MAHNFDDPEFWLPPLFLSDDSVSDFNKTEFLVSESNSGFSSPVDSSTRSTETESDEDEFLTELTRRLTNSTQISHDIWKQKPNHGFLPCEKADTSWKMPTSPQSTIYNEEVAKKPRIQQDTSTGYLHFGAPPQKPCLNSVLPNTKNHAYHSNQRIMYQPLEQNGINNVRAIGLSASAWPTLQQSQFHRQPLPVPWTGAASNIPKRQCTGTGVFLPRPVATETPRKKQPASKQRNVSTQLQQRRDKSRCPSTMDNEIRLPQEWTY
ncbi:hypothetical protein POM88_006700 [Heracleum sosnowskyi]|uniref:Uncharacterized protein n=1 Tax=Heracleum sosnowskyi TaxID=360622 RepID=A0AAD8J6I0_9APIA|nr:hypothetical protein POM88_006700 [Heracleum sosnowskyi]